MTPQLGRVVPVTSGRAGDTNLTDRLAALLPDLRSEFPEWTIHRSTSGRWLAIHGNTCIRAQNTTELRERIRRHLAVLAEDIAGDPA